MKSKHWAVFITNESNKSEFIRSLLKGTPPSAMEELAELNGVLFSKLAIAEYIDEEDRHGTKIISKHSPQTLQSMSSGEQKKALLNYLLQNNSDYIILDNPFDNLDTDSQEKLRSTLAENAVQKNFVLLISRKDDLLSFIKNYASLNESKLVLHTDLGFLANLAKKIPFSGRVPEPIRTINYQNNELVSLHNCTIQFENKTVLKNINWTIKTGEFWQLIGKNGSGKTTILSMITGDNPKGYGQDLILFGQKKGSGESIWDIKQKIGYFTPAMTDKFTGYHSIENMLISGLM